MIQGIREGNPLAFDFIKKQAIFVVVYFNTSVGLTAYPNPFKNRPPNVVNW